MKINMIEVNQKSNVPGINQQNKLRIKIALVKLENQLMKGGYSRCVLYSTFLSGLANHLEINHSQVVRELVSADCTDYEIFSYYVLAQYSPKEIASHLFGAGWDSERIAGALNLALENELQGVSTPLHIIAFLLESKMPDIEVIKIMVGIDCFVHLCVESLLSCGWTASRLLVSVISSGVISEHVYDTLLMDYGGKKLLDAELIFKKMIEFSYEHSEIIKFLCDGKEDDEMICLAADSVKWSDLTLFKAYFDSGCEISRVIDLMWRFKVDAGIMNNIVGLIGLSDEEIIVKMQENQGWKIGKILCLLRSFGRQPDQIITAVSFIKNRENEVREALNYKKRCQECSHCRNFFKGGSLTQWRQILERSIDRNAIDELLF